MHRNVTRTLIALGFAGALAVGTAAPTLAQGIYFDAPGVHVGVGKRHYRSYYDDGPYYRSYGYYDARPYWRHRGYRYHDRW